MKGPSVGLLGFSKGGDLCLSMASFLKDITATVLINACVANTIAPLHYKDMIIPDLGSDSRKYSITESGLFDLMDIWNNPLEEPYHQSLIPLEKAQGPLLFIVGMDDHNWKSEFYAHLASERLQAHGKDRPPGADRTHPRKRSHGPPGLYVGGTGDLPRPTVCAAAAPGTRSGPGLPDFRGPVGRKAGIPGPGGCT